MQERVIESTEKEYKRFEAVAKMLEMLSPNGARYEVNVCYLDFGQNWMWTTILRRGYRECQILSPRQWEEIMLAETPQDIANIVEDIRNGEYFGDK